RRLEHLDRLVEAPHHRQAPALLQPERREVGSLERWLDERILDDGKRALVLPLLAEDRRHATPAADVPPPLPPFGVEAEGLVVVADEIVQVGELEQDLDAPVLELGQLLRNLCGAAEVDDRLRVRVQPLGTLAGTDEIVQRLRTCLAEVEMPREELQ